MNIQEELKARSRVGWNGRGKDISTLDSRVRMQEYPFHLFVGLQSGAYSRYQG